MKRWWWLLVPVPNSNGMFSLRFVCDVDCIYKKYCGFFFSRKRVEDRIWLKELQIDSTSENGDDFAMECLSLSSKEIVLVLFCGCTLKCNTSFSWVRRICNEHIHASVRASMWLRQLHLYVGRQAKMKFFGKQIVWQPFHFENPKIFLAATSRFRILFQLFDSSLRAHMMNFSSA